MKLIMSAGALALLAATSQAGFVQSTSSIGDNAMLLSDFVTANSLSDASSLRINSIGSVSGAVNSRVMNFGSVPSAVNSALNGNFTVSVSANDSLNYYLDDVATLNGGNNDVWFNGGANNTPDDGTDVLAFGNNASESNSNSVTLTFAPGVTAFGFNYDDMEFSDLEVTWGSGMTESVDITNVEGFMSIVSSAGDTITSLKLTQITGSANDGFSFYGFQTVQVVPLPTGALAGLGILGGLGVIRTVRRR
jgi:hypothetical protein